MNNLNFIHLEQTFAVTPQVIWEHLTQLHYLQQWFFKELEDFSPRVGFSTSFAFDYNGKTFTHCWEVVEALPQERLVLLWSYKEYSGRAEVHFELSSTPHGCLVILTEKLLQPFPAIKEFKRTNRKTGWKSVLQSRLVDAVSKV